MADSAVRELLRDAFTRLIEHVDGLTDGLTDEQATYQPTPDANSIAWLIWHSARVQDVQLAPIAGVDQVSLAMRGGADVIWGSDAQSALKAEVLVRLLAQPGHTYDVSVPGQPVTSTR